MNRRLLALLLVVAVGEILAAQWLREPLSPGMPVYRIVHLVEIMLLIALCAAEYALRDRIARLVIAGLILSFVGDVINSYLFDLGFILQPQTLLSIPPFVLAHLCYIAAFVMLIRGASTARFPWLRLALACPPLALALWWLVIDRGAPPLLLKLSVGYALVVTMMGLVAMLAGLRLGGKVWIPALGGLVFVASDLILGCFLLEGQQRPVLVSQMIWVTYFLAQCLISRVPLLSPSVKS